MHSLKTLLSQSSPIAAYGFGLADGSPRHTDAMFEELRQWAKALLFITLFYALVFCCQHVLATTTDQFSAASDQVEGWVKGNLGKIAALCCVIMGMFMAAFRKDWTWLFGGIALGIVVGIVVGIIDGSFTATL